MAKKASRDTVNFNLFQSQKASKSRGKSASKPRAPKAKTTKAPKTKATPVAEAPKVDTPSSTSCLTS